MSAKNELQIQTGKTDLEKWPLYTLGGIPSSPVWAGQTLSFGIDTKSLDAGPHTDLKKAGKMAEEAVVSAREACREVEAMKRASESFQADQVESMRQKVERADDSFVTFKKASTVA